MEGNTLIVSGREAFAEEDWTGAYESLTAAEREQPLGPEDVERLALLKAVRAALTT